MRLFVKILLGIFAVFLLSPVIFDGTISSVIFPLAFGWVQFLQRTLPKLTWNWDLFGMALLSILAILFLAHKFLAGLSKGIASKRGSNWIWPWKWTWSSLVAVLLLFLVGMAVGGTAHQIGWLASSPESMFERKPFYFTAINDMKQIELTIRIASGETDEQIENVRKEFWKSKADLFGPHVDVDSMMQKYCVLVVVDDARKVLGTIIFPRNVVTRKQVGGLYSVETENFMERNESKLAKLVEKHREHLVSF